MKIITFKNSKYSFNSATSYVGMSVLCHIEIFDDEKVIIEAAKSIYKKAQEENIILIPFAHLDEKVSPLKQAEKQFNELFVQLSLMGNKNIYKIPFNIGKGFKLEVNEKVASVNYSTYKTSNINFIKNLYDYYSSGYDKHMQETGHYDAQNKLYLKIKNSINGVIIDLACGPGNILSKLSNDFKTVYGNDISEKMISLARAKSSLNCKFISIDATKLKPISGKKFDTIICSNLFYYINDKEKAIKNWKNNLNSNGRIIFIEEYPFIQPKSDDLPGKKSGITSIILPVSPDEIIALMEHNKFILREKHKVKIDHQHDLYGLVFEK